MTRLLNSNGRPPLQKDSDLITRKEALAIAEATAVKVAEFYMAQVPALVGQILVNQGLAKPIEAPPAEEPPAL